MDNVEEENKLQQHINVKFHFDSTIHSNSFICPLITYHTDEWGCVEPTEFPEFHWIIANHFFDTIVESINTKCPRNRHTFEKDKEEQTKTTNRIRVQYLEDIHSTLQKNNHRIFFC